MGGGTELDIKEALDILYGKGSRDIDPEGYLDAIRVFETKTLISPRG